ncbi:hypothetical protein PG995_002776 [Apiospora arundinis]
MNPPVKVASEKLNKAEDELEGVEKTRSDLESQRDSIDQAQRELDSRQEVLLQQQQDLENGHKTLKGLHQTKTGPQYLGVGFFHRETFDCWYTHPELRPDNKKIDKNGGNKSNNQKAKKPPKNKKDKKDKEFVALSTDDPRVFKEKLHQVEHVLATCSSSSTLRCVRYHPSSRPASKAAPEHALSTTRSQNTSQYLFGEVFASSTAAGVRIRAALLGVWRFRPPDRSSSYFMLLSLVHARYPRTEASTVINALLRLHQKAIADE